MMNRRLVLPVLLVLLAGSAVGVVTSVDSVQYDSNSEFFEGEVINLQYVSDFSDEKINVHLSEDVLSSQTGQQVENDLQLEVTSQNSYLRYGTQDIGLYELFTVEAVTHVENTQSQAMDWGEENCWGPGGIYGKNVLTFSGLKFKIWCVTPNEKLSSVASLTNPDTIYKTDWQLNAGGKESQSVTISNQNQKSTVQLGDHAVITGIAGLTTGASKPSISNVYAAHSNDLDGNWRIISQQRYNNWYNYITNSYSSNIDQWASGEISKSQVESFANDRADNALHPASQTEIYGAEVEDSSFESGTFRYDTSEELLFPQFNVYIDAGEDGYVTVRKPVGEARITDSSGAEFGELDSGRVSVTFRNVADVSGSFSGGVRSCSDSLQFDGIEKDVDSLDSGSTHTFEFLVSGSSGLDQEQVEGSCELQVSNSMGDSKSTSVDVTINSETECGTAGNEILREQDGNDVIMVCTDGFNLERQDGDAVCGEGEEARLVSTENGLNDWECRDTDNPPTGDEEICGNNIDDDGDGEVDENCGDPPNCVLFSIGQNSLLIPEFEAVNPFCGEDSFLNQVTTVFHWFFAVMIGSTVGYIFYYTARWIDGERSIRGSFKLSSRNVSRVKKGSAAIGAIAGLIGLLIGITVGLSIPLWMEVLFLGLMVVLAWVLDTYLGLFTVFTG